MINLIPPTAKKSLKFEYWIRVFSVWLLIWATTLIIGASLLLPTYVLIGSQIVAFSESAALASEKVNNYQNVSKTLVQSSQQARFALNESELPAISDYVDSLKSLEGSDIIISRISVRRDADGLQPIQVSGEAESRQSLASFRDRIVAEETVMEVDLPISNLAQDKEIFFNLTVLLNNEKNI
jgi:hypothetical protein